MLIERIIRSPRALENPFASTDRRGRRLLLCAQIVAEKKSQRDEKLREER
jgi:hypothetical protein